MRYITFSFHRFAINISQALKALRRLLVSISIVLLLAINVQAQFDKQFVVAVDATNSITTLTAEEVACRAARNASLANLIRDEAATGLSSENPRDRSRMLAARMRKLFLQSLAARQSQIAAQKGLEAHYALQALIASQANLRASDDLVQRRRQQMQIALSRGLPAPDMTILDRLEIGLQDQAYSTQSNIDHLRAQLVRLIGDPIACSYLPEFPGEILEPNDNLCDLIELAYHQRCDLFAWTELKSHLSLDSLDAARLAVASVTGIAPLPPPRRLRLIEQILQPSKSRKEAELSQRQCQLDDIIEFQRHQIASEVESAWIDQHTAFSRWQLANEIVASWRLRLDQIKRMMEQLRAEPQLQFDAELQLQSALGEVLKRWNDFQQATARLRSAVGSLP